MPGTELELTAVTGVEAQRITVSLSPSRAVLRVPHGLSQLRPFELGATLDAVIALGYRCVVLDLPSRDFLERPAELRAVVLAASRLIDSAGELVIRTPSGNETHVYDLERMGELIRQDISGSRPGQHLGPEQSQRGAAPTQASGSLGQVAQLEDGRPIPPTAVVDGVLRLVVALARATVGGADGVSVSLRRHGHLATVAASDNTISAMDADQYATGEGPCVDASIHGRWFHAESLAAEIRWPTFTPQARQLGINAILSSPLFSQARPVGALNIYSRTTAAFSAEDQRLAAVFAAEASIILSEEGVDSSTGPPPERLRTLSLASRSPATESDNYYG